MATPTARPRHTVARVRRRPLPLYRLMRGHAPLIRHEPTGSHLISRHEGVGRAFEDRESVFTTGNDDWQVERAFPERPLIVVRRLG